jgi:hypothetical protein
MSNKLVPVFALLLLSNVLFAFDEEERRSIDIDRRSLSFSSQEAFEKSREYIRRDSTYYIGWMYRGAYLFDRANDEKGFTQAIEPLKKALDQIERDYDKQLRTRTNDYIGYLAVSYLHTDYSNIANWLSGAYQNIENAQAAYDVLIRVKERDMQYEYSIDSWNTLAWIYHRNRMYTSDKFPFLLNSVAENDSMAYDCLDSAIAKTQRDVEICNGLFDPSSFNARYYFTYHYKVILFTYDFELDSADYYYDILLQSGYYSSNNYANYMYMKGEFSIAEQFYLEAENRDYSTDKHTREYFYMRGLLEVNRATPDRADSLLEAVINKDGQTPGYGWHNIARARAQTYQGLTTIAQRTLNGAARFEELHIGTTWGKEQYNLSVAMLNYMNQLHFESEYFFENNQWYFWFNPVNWYKALEFKVRVHHFKLILVSLVASNPERAAVIYPLFSSENLLSWDESWQMLDGFSDKYFIDVYEAMLEKDPRPGVKNYIKFVLAKLYISNGDEDVGLEYLEEIYDQLSIERVDFDNMLYARTCEAIAQISDGDLKQEWLKEAYNTFPQMIPYSNETLDFNVTFDGESYKPGPQDTLYKIGWFFGLLTVALLGLYSAARRYLKFHHSPKWIYGSGTGVVVICLAIVLWNQFGRDKLSTREQVISSLTECNVGFTDDPLAPKADFLFVNNDSAITVEYKIWDTDSRVVNEGSYTVDENKPNLAGIVLAYRMFKIDINYNTAVDAVDVDEETPEAEAAEN